MDKEEGLKALMNIYGLNADVKPVGAIYLYLAAHPGKEFSVNELFESGETNLSLATIKKTLNKLKSLGLIRCRGFRPMLYWYEP